MYKIIQHENKKFKGIFCNLFAMQAKFFSQNELPRPKSLPIIGTKYDFISAGGASRLHEYIDKRHNQLGPIFCENLSGNADLVFISDPQLIKTLFLSLEGKYPDHILPNPWVFYEKLYGSKRGLFFMSGQEWLDNRRIMNKLLLREGGDNWLTAPIKMTIEKFISDWKSKTETRPFEPNLESEFYRLSTDVVVAVLTGSNSTVRNKHYEEMMHTFSESVKKIFTTTNRLYNLPLYWCHLLNLKVWRDFKECVDESLYYAQKIVGEMLNNENMNNGLIYKLVQESVPKEIITRIAADFVIAAGDTTAYTLIWNLYTIANYEEGINDIRVNGRQVVTNYVKESMRMYPVAPFLTRILPKDSSLGSYKLEKGTPIIASIYTSGWDNKNFSRANEFLPFRWDRNDLRRSQLDNHVPSASLPFALGARSCIGRKMAMIMLTESILQIVDNFNFRCINDAPVKSITSQILVPDKPVQLKFMLEQD